MKRFWLGIMVIALSLAGTMLGTHIPTPEYSSSSSFPPKTIRSSKAFRVNYSYLLELADEEETLRKGCKARFVSGRHTPAPTFSFSRIVTETPHTNVHYPFTPSDKMGVFCYTRRLRV